MHSENFEKSDNSLAASSEVIWRKKDGLCKSVCVCAHMCVLCSLSYTHINLTIPHITMLLDINSLISSKHDIALKHPHFKVS